MELTKEQIIKVYNTGHSGFVKLLYRDYEIISEFLPLPGSNEFNNLSDREQTTVLRVHEIMSLQAKSIERMKADGTYRENE